MHFAPITVPLKTSKQNEIVAHCQSICSKFKVCSLWNCSTNFLYLFSLLQNSLIPFIKVATQTTLKSTTTQHGPPFILFFLWSLPVYKPSSPITFPHQQILFSFCISNTSTHCIILRLVFVISLPLSAPHIFFNLTYLILQKLSMQFFSILNLSRGSHYSNVIKSVFYQSASLCQPRNLFSQLSEKLILN